MPPVPGSLAKQREQNFRYDLIIDNVVIREHVDREEALRLLNDYFNDRYFDDHITEISVRRVTNN